MRTRINTINHRAVRAAVTLAVVLMATATAWAQTQYISEVMLIGKNNKTEANEMKAQYEAQGWTVIDHDLNKGCGSGSDYIYLLYKQRTTASPNHIHHRFPNQRCLWRCSREPCQRRPPLHTCALRGRRSLQGEEGRPEQQCRW